MREPTSKFEKLLAGLQALEWMQPAAKLDAAEGKIWFANTEDEHISEAMVTYLKGLGFAVDSTRKMFVFDVR